MFVSPDCREPAPLVTEISDVLDRSRGALNAEKKTPLALGEKSK
jgi:hypothetical protein